MVTPTRYARVGFLRLAISLPINGLGIETEPGTASRTAETKGQKQPPSDFSLLQRPHFATLNPQKPGGSRPSRQRQRLWGLSGLRGGPERTLTSLQTIILGQQEKTGGIYDSTCSTPMLRQSISYSRSFTGGRLKCQVTPDRAAPRRTISAARNGWMSCTV